MSFSSALLTDSDDVTAAAVTSASVELTAAPVSLDFALTAALPGDSGTVQDVTVTNSGTAELRYSVTSVTDEDALASELRLDVWLESAEASSGDGCSDAVPAGGYLHQGAYGATGSGVAVLGDVAPGVQADERTLASGVSEVLCLDVTLPTGATTQGATTSATFTFDSEQTANS